MPRDGATGVYTRPPGTDAVSNATASSLAYNRNVGDVEFDLNYPRPISAGGTGGNNAADAVKNLGAEKANQIVTDFLTHLWVPGSFSAAASPIHNGPVANHAFSGIVYVADNPPPTPPTQASDIIIEARDRDDFGTLGTRYTRQRKAGTWGTWVKESPTYGQCFLGLFGGAVTLYPWSGNLITINGANQVIPDAGVTLSPVGLTPGTTYNIYAYMSGAPAVVTLEASTTTHIWQPGTGIRIKNGDFTRTLVGKAKVEPGPSFIDGPQKRFVISWFNRRPLMLYHNWSVAPTTTSVTHIQLNSAATLQFLCWSDSTLFVSWYGVVGQSNAGAYTYTTFGIDGGTYPPSQPMWFISGSGANYFAVAMSVVFDSASGINDGYHNVDVYGYVSAGTGQWGIVGVAFPRTVALLLP